MTDTKFLTIEEVSERSRAAISVGTLRNWRAMQIGPPYVKIGKAVLYPINELDPWDRKNMMNLSRTKPIRSNQQCVTFTHEHRKPSHLRLPIAQRNDIAIYLQALKIKFRKMHNYPA